MLLSIGQSRSEGSGHGLACSPCAKTEIWLQKKNRQKRLEKIIFIFMVHLVSQNYVFFKHKLTFISV